MLDPPRGRSGEFLPPRCPAGVRALVSLSPKSPRPDPIRPSSFPPTQPTPPFAPLDSRKLILNQKATKQPIDPTIVAPAHSLRGHQHHHHHHLDPLDNSHLPTHIPHCYPSRPSSSSTLLSHTILLAAHPQQASRHDRVARHAPSLPRSHARYPLRPPTRRIGQHKHRGLLPLPLLPRTGSPLTHPSFRAGTSPDGCCFTRSTVVPPTELTPL